MITLNRFGEGRLFLSDTTLVNDAGFMAYLAAALPDPSVRSISVNDAWYTYTGFYLFMKKAPAEADMQRFASAISAYFEQHYANINYTSFAWIAADAPLFTVSDVTVVLAAVVDGKIIVPAATLFRFRNYSIPLKSSAAIVPVKDDQGNIIAFNLPGASADIQLPLSGKGRGALLGQVSLDDLSDNPATGWNASLYYVINVNGQQVAQNYPLFDTASEQVQLLFNYMLDPVDAGNPDRTYFAFTRTLFRKHGQDDSGQLPTYFRTVYGNKINLIPLPDSTQPPKLVFEALPPVDGAPVYYLAPSGDFGLVLVGDVALTDYLLCGLSGAESVQFTSAAAINNGSVLRFVAGQNAYAPVFPIINITGKSTVATPKSVAKAGEVFRRELKAYQTAKANNDVALLKSLQDTPSLLDGTYKTSWINIRPYDDNSEVPVYYSQPNDAALYSHDGIIADVADELLQIKNTAAAFLSTAVTQSMPMVPYTGVNAAAAFPFTDIQQFESQVLVAARRAVVSSIPIEAQTRGRVAAENIIITTTPQGLLATVPDSGLNWGSVVLAKSVGKGIPYSLAFVDGITRELRDVLQSNQMFMVASEAAPLGDFLNKITISDWPFTINVGKGSDNGLFSNILIFKFAEGSLADRVSDPGSWASASVFNENPVLVSKWILSYIETARLNVKTDPRYANFLNIVDNPLWNGILALQVDIGVENFPDDLKGLLAGINRDEFFAHHFGIEINFTQPDENGQLTLPKSSLFGLIDYVDKDYRTQQDVQDYLSSNQIVFSLQEIKSPVQDNNGVQSLYDFKVLTLQVVFDNSAIKDFVSKIQLTATTWFDEPAQLEESNMGNSLTSQTIEFNGSYESHNGVDTYTFVTQPDQTYKFLLQSQTMNYVEIVKAQFFTITDQTSPGVEEDGDTESIISRFVFWGYMNFQQIASFDIYSFGDLAGEQYTNNKGLYFANLNINMNFTLDKVSGNATDRVFTFDPNLMSFDISQSTPRSGSLFTNFPINLAGLIYSREGADAKPSDLGYLPVIIQSPTPLKGQSVSQRWYSLLYNLNFGSMGALAAKAGFVSQVSTAWSPDTAIRRLEAGIQLPGVGGQKTLSLQSVLSVNIQSFTFFSAYDNAGSKLAYLLKLNNVKLSLLGKKIPGAADTQFILFGDPSGADKTTLAWYAAYYANKPK